MEEFDFVRLPPNYSEHDRDRLDQLKAELAALQRHYNAAAKVILDEAAAIEAKYPYRMIGYPKLA